jgi:hypothetical protein
VEVPKSNDCFSKQKFGEGSLSRITERQQGNPVELPEIKEVQSK